MDGMKTPAPPPLSDIQPPLCARRFVDDDGSDAGFDADPEIVAEEEEEDFRLRRLVVSEMLSKIHLHVL